MEYAFTHPKDRTVAKPAEGITSNRVWNKHFHKGSSTSRCTAEPTGKNAQIALFIHNSAQWQTVNRTNWQKAPIVLCAQKRFAQVHTGGLYWVLELVSSSICMYLSFSQRKACQQPVPSREETRRIPKTNGFCSSYESPSKYPSWGQLAMSSWLIATILACCSSRWLLKTQRARCHESTASRWVPKSCYQKSVSCCCWLL